ncbi:MAG TPA: DUF1697 domain-containing protein [Candidatus Saccharimonadales bacterium]|nr:DUF1697 domain-containing protein [Candidatus Saccharimonadales bacterium]
MIKTTYVALLRGINVGGKAKVEMPRLKTTFERIGLEQVSTYINSGNVIFRSEEDPKKLVVKIETEIKKNFGLVVPVVIRSLKKIQAINSALPASWLNNTEVRTDILFLWEDVATPDVMNQIATKPKIDNVKYIDGTILWHVSRQNQTKSGLLKILGTPLYKRISIRNANTVRKLGDLMEATDNGS